MRRGFRGHLGYRTLAGGLALMLQCSAAPAAPTDGEQRFRELYRELVETDTTITTGSCTLAAEKVAKRLTAAGYPQGNVRLIVPAEGPREGNLVATLPGSDPKLPALLLLAHIDVVEAKASDWARDPFKLVEENGYFYARGAVDDKAMASSFVDALIRYREEGYRPRRTIKLALTCGEETNAAINGVTYILAREPGLLAAGWAINEGSKSVLDASGRALSLGVQSGDKVYQDFSLVAVTPGGHSARPSGDNAIDLLSGALVRISAYRFPVNLSNVSREFFKRSAALYDAPIAADMAAIGAGKADPAAFDRIAKANPLWNAFLRTTCISTLIQGGHAINAQPQRAEANINCRIIPGEPVESIHARLIALAADPKIQINLAEPPGPQASAPPLAPHIMEPVERIAAEMWPGVPVIPSISTGATDGRYLNAAGIPTYGISGLFIDPDGNGVHGLDERVRIRSLMDSRAFLYRLIKAYSGK